MKKKFFIKTVFYFFIGVFLSLIPTITWAADTCSIRNTDCLSPRQPTFWLVSSSALVDSINPCAIAVMLFLLSAMLFFGDKKRLLKVGIAFMAGLYVTYLAFGLGLFYALKLNTLINPEIFHLVMGALGIIAGLLNIKDYFWYGGGGFLMEIPRKWRPKMSMIIAKATSVPAAFITGIIVTFFELPCTGGPYVFILGILSANTSKFLIIPILLYYNVLFILPLIIILAGVYFGFMEVEKAEHWKQRNLRRLHLVAGIILVLMGVWVIWS